MQGLFYFVCYYFMNNGSGGVVSLTAFLMNIGSGGVVSFLIFNVVDTLFNEGVIFPVGVGAVLSF